MDREMFGLCTATSADSALIPGGAKTNMTLTVKASSKGGLLFINEADNKSAPNSV